MGKPGWYRQVVWWAHDLTYTIEDRAPVIAWRIRFKTTTKSTRR
jgi:hypothetical protein